MPQIAISPSARGSFMPIIKSFCAVASALILCTVTAHAADAEHGRDLAKRWCASCHLVAPDQQSASADVPPFATIAQSPNFNAKQLSYYLLEPHPKMPQMALSRSAADDIAAYIGSLKK
jgi:mono/diheme cytochrome c family protein